MSHYKTQDRYLHKELRKQKQKASSFQRLRDREHGRLIHTKSVTSELVQEHEFMRERIRSLERILSESLCFLWVDINGQDTPPIRTIRATARTLLSKKTLSEQRITGNTDGNMKIAAGSYRGTFPGPCNNGSNIGTMKPVKNSSDNGEVATDTAGARVREDQSVVAKSPNTVPLFQSLTGHSPDR